jgi:hypothetical protein
MINNSYLPELNSVWKDYMEEKVNIVDKLHEDGGRSFIFFTDTHGEYGHHNKYGATLIEYARKALGINTVIFGGDPIAKGGVSHEEARVLLQVFTFCEFFNVQKETALYAVGNHDSNICFASTQPDLYKVLIPDTEVFEDTVEQSLKLGKKLVFDSKAIRTTEKLRYKDIDGFTAEELKEQAIADIKFHYHYDDDEAKIRYIIFNTGAMGVSHCALYGALKGGIGWSDYCLLQLGWLIETLESTPDDYDVIVAGHTLTHDWAIGKTDWSTNTFTEHIDGALYNYNQESINSILSLYKLRKRGEYRVNCDKKGPDEDTYYNIKKMASSADCATLDGDSIIFKYDFSKRTNTKKTVAFLTGHMHCDRSWISGFDSETGEYRSYRCYPNDEFKMDIDGGVLGIMTSCDCQQMIDVKDKFEVVSGTTESNVIDIVTLMPNGAVYCTRIGAGESRYFKEYK